MRAAAKRLVALCALLAGAAPPAARAQTPAPAPAQAQAQAQGLSLKPPALQLPEAEPPGYALHVTKNGGYTFDQDAWSVAIAPDGGVTFTDHDVKITSLKLGPIRLMAPNGPRRPSLQNVLSDLAHGHPPPDPWEEARAPISRYHADPRLACTARTACYFVPGAGILVGVGGLADLTDIYMRHFHQDPYRRAKARFLVATQDLRAKMAARAHAAYLRTSLAELPARLGALWDDPERVAVEKRLIFWLLWSEATEGDAGAAARAIIERFIRERLPRGSPDGYTDEELVRYRQSSRGAFAPYGEAVPAGGDAGAS
jgi:hypothetical protein